jgi:hypothetical protein
MSAIDQYAYTCIGVIECPSPYELLMGHPGDQPIHVAIYYLEEDIPRDEEDFQGKRGDMLIGGGGGEAPAMLIRVQDALIYYTEFDSDHDQVTFEREHASVFECVPYQAFWSPTQAFILGSGYVKLGWSPEQQQIERWLTHHVLAFALQTYPELFKFERSRVMLDEDGSVCRSLTSDEEKIMNWKKYRDKS